MTVRYQAVDDNNKLFADLTNLYLDENASYGRDTKGQNKKVKGIRAKIDKGNARALANGSDKPRATATTELQTRSADLRAHLATMQSQIESLTASLALLRQEVAALDEAIRAKEAALEQAAKPKKK